MTGLYSITLGVPLAVLGEAAGPYDDPKVWALLILTAGTGLAWLVHAWKGPGRPSQAPDKRARVLRGIILCCASWWIITTATSIAPLQSLQGAFGRGMGLLTMASAALIFFLVQSECRTPRAVRSIVDVALLGSVPVCLLALGQAGGWDPLPKPWDPAVTGLAVRSTFGQHMFLGSYLVVLIPVTAARLEWALSGQRESADGLAPASVQWLPVLAGAAWVAGAVGLAVCGSYWPSVRWALPAWGIVGGAAWAVRDDAGGRRDDTVLSASLLAGLLVVQVLVVILSQGRGGFVGMLVGLSVTALAVLARRRVWKTLTVVGLGLVALVGLLALLNSSRAPSTILSHMGPLSRLSEAANMRPGTPAWFRVQVWRGILDGWSRQLHGEEVIPGLSPGMRSIIGYGPETQILVLDSMAGPFLGVLRTKSVGGRPSYQYAADRAHNVLLEQLVTGGLGGVALWGLLVGSLVVVGIARIRASASHGEATMRLGALGAVCGHLAEGQVGIATAMPLVLFWLGAALLTSQPWTTAANLSSVSQRVAPRRGWRWSTALVIATLLAVLIAWTSTRWLLASVAFADATRHGAEGLTAEAHRYFQRSVALAPGLPLPAEGAAYTAFRLAGRESDPATRRELLREAAAVLVRARHQAAGSVASWTLTAQVAFAQARAGDRSKLAASLDAFGIADRLRPDDPELLAQWAWAWLESGDAARARETAERALAREPRDWLAWAVLAHAASELGDGAEAERARGRARQLAPPEARRLVDTIAP